MERKPPEWRQNPPSKRQGPSPSGQEQRNHTKTPRRPRTEDLLRRAAYQQGRRSRETRAKIAKDFPPPLAKGVRKESRRE